jgi:hypothetical protein
MRVIAIALAALGLAACGDAEEAKQGAAELGRQALESVRSAVTTQTVCTLAGQSDAFCGCVQERLGPEISDEHVEALSIVVRRTLEGEGVEGALEGAQNIDAPTREALLHCAAQTAMQDAAAAGR